jgi:SAM-dependent methyltransferase
MDEVAAKRKAKKEKTRTILAVEAELLTEIRRTVESPLLYDLGCGQRPEPDYIGLDLYATGERIRKADLYREPWSVYYPSVMAFDIDKGEEREVFGATLRIRDESVDLLHSSHFLEHVPDWNLHFREAYRVLKPGGHYIIKAPYFLNSRYFQDPDHKQPVFEARFAYLSWDWLVREKQEHARDRVNFSVLNGEFYFAPHEDYESAGFSEERIAWDKVHCFNVIDDIAVVLRKEPMPEAANA